MFTFTACSVTKTKTSQHIKIPINHSLFSLEKRTLIDEQAIFTLTQEQQTKFLLHFNNKVSQGFKAHEALGEILKARLSNFTYYGETYDASTAMRLNKGNCMSLAILTTAYAKLIGIDFAYRTVHTLPVFSKKAGIILSSSHVQTIIYDDTFVAEDDYFYLSTPGIVVDYFPSEGNRKGIKYSYKTFLAMYYKNLAADALVEKDLAKSFLYANTAYQYNANNTAVINLLAVIHRRAGDLKTAELIYKEGLKVGKPNISLLSNYIMLLKSQHRIEEATALQSQMNKLDDPNPYHSLGEAFIARKKGNTTQAEIHFKKALEKAPYLNQAYMGLYRIYAEQQKHDKAQVMLIKALEWTYELDERKLYKHKLYSLQQSIVGAN
jgi:Tfp pilus assembly protein PilF